MNIDWKDALKNLQESGDIPAASVEENEAAEEVSEKPEKKETLHIFVERKGRHGKTATIIEGFECSQEELQQTAATLKKKIGTGGSARGGEILLQGEFRDKAIDALRSLGYKVK
ncbi:MAG: translation initiation factor [Muribaculaceae bacterium]|nr:translation initiation factor [Muribaculaceae bacterium]